MGGSVGPKAGPTYLVVGDAAQSFGAKRDNRRVGTLAPVTATSFFPAKPLGCYGDGGAIFTDDDALAATMRSIRLHGQRTPIEGTPLKGTLPYGLISGWRRGLWGAP